MKLLLAEDSPELASLLSELFIDLGFVVEHAINGVEAQRILQDTKFDVIVCDHRMPRSLGNEVYSFLRTRIQDTDTPFIHHSSVPVPEEYINADEDRNFHVVLKNGFNPDLFSLLERIKNRTSGSGPK